MDKFNIYIKDKSIYVRLDLVSFAYIAGKVIVIHSHGVQIRFCRVDDYEKNKDLFVGDQPIPPEKYDHLLNYFSLIEEKEKDGDKQN